MDRNKIMSRILKKEKQEDQENMQEGTVLRILPVRAVSIELDKRRDAGEKIYEALTEDIISAASEEVSNRLVDGKSKYRIVVPNGGYTVNDSNAYIERADGNEMSLTESSVLIKAITDRVASYLEEMEPEKLMKAAHIKEHEGLEKREVSKEYIVDVPMPDYLTQQHAVLTDLTNGQSVRVKVSDDGQNFETLDFDIDKESESENVLGIQNDDEHVRLILVQDGSNEDKPEEYHVFQVDSPYIIKYCPDNGETIVLKNDIEIYRAAKTPSCTWHNIAMMGILRHEFNYYIMNAVSTYFGLTRDNLPYQTSVSVKPVLDSKNQNKNGTTRACYRLSTILPLQFDNKIDEVPISIDIDPKEIYEAGEDGYMELDTQLRQATCELAAEIVKEKLKA